MKLLSTLFIALFLLSTSPLLAQTDTTTLTDQPAEVEPEFPGGEEAMLKFLNTSINYPKEALNNGIQGKVLVDFIIEKDGSVSNVKVSRGLGFGCDEEAIRVISSMPRWSPGFSKGKPVRVYYQIPFSFALEPATPRQNTKKQERRERRVQRNGY